MPNRRGGNARPGDATGRQREELQDRHREELNERKDQMTLAQQLADEESDQVVDLTGTTTLTPGTRQPGMPGVGVDEDGVMTVEGQEEVPVQTNATSIIGQGPEGPNEAPGYTPADQRQRQIVDRGNPAFTARQTEPVDAGEEASVVIRVRETCSPTIGAGQNYEFQEGRQYRVPAHVAEHLEEKGMVWH